MDDSAIKLEKKIIKIVSVRVCTLHRFAVNMHESVWLPGSVGPAGGTYSAVP